MINLKILYLIAYTIIVIALWIIIAIVLNKKESKKQTKTNKRMMKDETRANKR